MLDTNIVSFAIRGIESVRKKIIEIPMTSICISAITEAELLRGLAKKTDAIQLKKLVHEFLLRVESLPWDFRAARTYAELRNSCEREGRSLGSIMDMLIASHAKSVDATLVTNDQTILRLGQREQVVDRTKS